MKPDRVKVGLRLRKLKDELGISLAEFAEKIDSNKGTFNSYLRGVALPPESTVDKIVMLTNSSKEWIYFGTPEEYMGDFIESLTNYDGFIKKYPEKIPKIVEEFVSSLDLLKLKKNISGDATLDELTNFYSETANEIFFMTYNTFFAEYVEKLVENFILKLEEYPIFNKSWVSNGNGYVSLLLERLNRTFPKPRFEEQDIIMKIAEEQYNLLINKILLKYKNDINFEEGKVQTISITEFISAKFKTYEGIEGLLKDIAIRNNLYFNPNELHTKELIELLISLSPRLEEIKKESIKKEG